MKKLISFLLIILSSCCLLCADNTPDPDVYSYPHYMLGHVSQATYFTSSILEEVLPFDFDNPEVYDDGYYISSVKGIRVGTYTLASNNASFVLEISHDKLNRIDSATNNPNLTTSIDYVLFIVTGDNESNYISCKSNTDPAVITGDIIGSGDTIILRDKSFYVLIQDDSVNGSTAATVDNLQPGIYESYIYFHLTGE